MQPGMAAASRERRAAPPLQFQTPPALRRARRSAGLCQAWKPQLIRTSSRRRVCCPPSQHRSNAYGEPGVKEQGFQPDRAWWERIFAVVDAGDAAAFVKLLTADARFRFGSAAPIVGS